VRRSKWFLEAALVLRLAAGERIRPQTVPPPHTPIGDHFAGKIKFVKTESYGFHLFQENRKNLLKKANTSYFSGKFNEKIPHPLNYQNLIDFHYKYS